MSGHRTDGPVVVELRRPLVPLGPGTVGADLRTAPPSRSGSAASTGSYGGSAQAFGRGSQSQGEELTSTSAERQRRSAMHVIASASGLANELREILHRAIPALKRQVNSARDDVADARFTAAESLAVVNRVSTEITRGEERRALAESLARKMAGTTTRGIRDPNAAHNVALPGDTEHNVAAATSSHHRDLAPRSVSPREDSTSPRLSFAATERDVSPSQPPPSSSPMPPSRAFAAARGTPVSIPVPKAAVAAEPVHDTKGATNHPDDTLASWKPAPQPQRKPAADAELLRAPVVVDIVAPAPAPAPELAPVPVPALEPFGERGRGAMDPDGEPVLFPESGAAGDGHLVGGAANSSATLGAVEKSPSEDTHRASVVVTGEVVSELASTTRATQSVTAVGRSRAAVGDPSSTLPMPERRPQHSPSSRTVRAIPVRRVRTPEPADRTTPVSSIHHSAGSGARGHQLHVPTRTPPVPQAATRTPRLPTSLLPQRRTATPPPPPHADRSAGAPASHMTPRSHRRAIQTPPPAFFSDDDATDETDDAGDRAVTRLSRGNAKPDQANSRGRREHHDESGRFPTAGAGSEPSDDACWSESRRVPVPKTRPRQPYISSNGSRSAVISPQLEDDGDDNELLDAAGRDGRLESRRRSPARPRITHRPAASPSRQRHRCPDGDGGNDDGVVVEAIEARLAQLVAERHRADRSEPPALRGAARTAHSRRTAPPWDR